MLCIFLVDKGFGLRKVCVVSLLGASHVWSRPSSGRLSRDGKGKWMVTTNFSSNYVYICLEGHFSPNKAIAAKREVNC